MKIPISLIIDDPAPVISVYHEHAKNPFTADGRPLVKSFSNELLTKFCDIIEQNGIKGKFSVVPMPANKGDIINGIEGVDKTLMAEWLNIVKKRVAKNFSIGPEMLTHHKAVDLNTGKTLDQKESVWANDKDRTVLTPYIEKALSILKQAGFDAFGVTSPWNFAIDVEEEYAYSIAHAVYNVTGKKNSWYFLRELCDRDNAKPWVAFDDGDKTVVSIPATTDDVIWDTIDTTDTSTEFINSLADKLISIDGKSGEIIRVLERGGYPILITHWQSLMSNGLGTGLKVLEEITKRVNNNLSDTVEWMSFEEIMEMVVVNKKDYQKPQF